MSDFLRRKGIHIFDGYRPENLSGRPDLVVVGNAVRRDNPEAVAMMRMALPFCSMPQAIGRFIAWDKKPIVVTGTHGKTTLSAVIAWIFYHAGFDPGFIIGGILNNFHGNYRFGSGVYLVLEGDEYDTAFFDKNSKFLHYHSNIAVLTGIEFDHADIYQDIHHVVRAFDRFIQGMGPDSALVVFDGNDHATRLAGGGACRIVTYGTRTTSTWRLGESEVQPPWSIFTVLKNSKHYGVFKTRLMGEHNLLNALASIAVADRAGIGPKIIAEGLKTFSGVKRRQEVRGRKRHITVMDDFAHHPTAVRETIRAVKPFFPNGRLIAVFEPRTNTSMRNVFQWAYTQAFDGADLICIRKPPLLHKIPEPERFSSEKLVDDLNHRGKTAHYFPDTESIIDFLVQEARAGDLVLIMSNGGFDNIHERLLNAF